MQRIAIIGCSGVGKSTLAVKLGERLGLPVTHLDALFWEADWVQSQTPVFRARVRAALAGGRWIAEGNYVSRIGDLTLAAADAVIWVSQPRWLSLWRVTWRMLRHLGKSRPDLNPECREKLDSELHVYIWSFDKLRRPRIEAALTELAPKRLIRLDGDRAISAFLAGLPPQAA